MLFANSARILERRRVVLVFCFWWFFKRILQGSFSHSLILRSLLLIGWWGSHGSHLSHKKQKFIDFYFRCFIIHKILQEASVSTTWSYPQANLLKESEIIKKILAKLSQPANAVSNTSLIRVRHVSIWSLFGIYA